MFSSCRIREAIKSLWPLGTAPSKLTFTIKPVRQRDIPKVDVVIGFSPAPVMGNEPVEQITLQQ
jgi:hypothetical protein